MTTTVDLRSITAREAMRTELHWTSPDEPLIRAARRMHKEGIRALLVRKNADDDTLPGIVTSKDIVNLLTSQDPAVLDHILVGDVATRPAVCIPAHANLTECITLMRMIGVRRMPVLEGRVIIGVLSTSDIFASIIG